MTQIILDSTQAQIFVQARDQIQFCDADGNLLGVLAPATKPDAPDDIFTPEEIAAAKRALAAPGPRRTTKEVLERLRAKWPEQE
jgi:hypothetical protein